jgi:hypothetical protein
MTVSSRSLVRQGTTAPIGVVAGTTRTEQISMFTYGTDDAAAVVEAAGYFNTLRGILNVGDQVHASMVLAGAPVFKIYIVTAAPKVTGNVTVAIQTVTAG